MGYVLQFREIAHKKNTLLLFASYFVQEKCEDWQEDANSYNFQETDYRQCR